MTDIMKLADDYADVRSLHGTLRVSEKTIEARDALQSAIEALQGDVERLKEINRDALSNLNELCDSKNAEIAALQAKLDELTKQAPVAIAEGHVLLWIAGRELDSERDHYLFAAPKALEPLTDDWIRERCDQTWVFNTVKQWVREVEAAHGITKGTPT